MKLYFHTDKYTQNQSLNVCVFKLVCSQLCQRMVVIECRGWDACWRRGWINGAINTSCIEFIKKATCRSQIRLQPPGECGSRGSAAGRVCCLGLKKVHRIGINRTRTFRCGIYCLLCCVVFSAAILFFYFQRLLKLPGFLEYFAFILWLRWGRFQVLFFFFFIWH